MSWRDRLKASLLKDDAGEQAQDAAASTQQARVVPIRADDDPLVEELRTKLAELADGKLDGVEIDPDGHMLDFGYIDSLTAVAFAAWLDERCGAPIDEMELVGSLSTLRAVAEHIRSNT